jgi:hypothetical protein
MRFLFLLLITSSSVFAQKYSWNNFVSKEGAFSVEFPFEPKISESTRTTEDGVDVKIKMAIASEQPVLAYVFYNEFPTGYMIFDDSLYLTTVTEQIMSRFGRQPDLLEDIRVNGFPGKHFMASEDDNFIEGKIILRINRAYIVVALFPKKNKKDADRFFASFKLNPYQKPNWVSFKSEKHSFTADFLEKPVEKTEEYEGGDLYSYYSKDQQSGLNYSVSISEYSPYDKFESDSAVLASIVHAYTLQGDSIVEETDIRIDNRPGKELILVRGQNHFRMRVRTFTHGKFGYTMLALLAPSEVKSETANKFFGSFHFTGKPEGDLLSDKSDVILRDIASSDTTVWYKAMEALSNYEFKESHSEKIQTLIKKPFSDDYKEESRRRYLLFALGKIKTETSLKFIPEVFAALKGHPLLKVEALDVLSLLNSEKGDDILISLLQRHEPSMDQGSHYTSLFSTYRIDSARQKNFLMKSLPLLKKQAYRNGVYALLSEMLEQKRATIGEFTLYRAQFSADLESQYKQLLKDSSAQYLYSLAAILGYTTLTKADIEVLNKIAASEINNYLAIQAAATLLRQNQKVQQKDLKRLASDRNLRSSMLNTFQGYELEKYFPSEYYRQDSIATADLYSYVADEYFEPSSIKIVHQEEVEQNGILNLFYVAKFTDPEEGTEYLGVCGPYQKGEISVWGALTGSNFDPKDLEKDYPTVLHDYIKQYEEYMD